MKKTKLNIIKLNILTTTLTLICISCAVNKIDPEPKSKTNKKENTKEFKNKSQNPDPLKTKNIEDIISKLKAIGKDLEAQQKQEKIEIDKIAAAQLDFLDTFKVGPRDLIVEENQMKMKRIIYSSLNYETEKIKILQGILEKLKQNPKAHNILGSFLYHISWGIQFNIEECLKGIKKAITDELHTLGQEKAERLLMQIESSLKLKQRFAKTLKETIEDYNKNLENIQTDAEKLVNHMNENYKEHDSLKPIY
ncbi:MULTISPECIES: complement regulator-acquiring protein [Borreliella]|uniref:complement regulator-acquiring protein n=1 Tax=Borreliella TaxID=64895 RepID=UPI00165D486A|nr:MULTISPECIES: complement regulator-acquiring protein [Borreliella]WLN24559.1 complement regulator-acquiring protein [Borreliella bavariensis]